MCHLCLSFPVRLCEIFYNNISQECLRWNFMRKSCGTKHDSAGCCEATGPTVCPFVSADYKMWTLCKVFHNSLLVTEVFWLPTLTPMSGCCYCSCLLRTALCLPGTFSLVQRCGQLAGSVCVRVCTLALVVTRACTCESFISLVSTQCTVTHVCTVYIGVCVCQLEAMCELSAKRAVLLPPCYWLTTWLERC